MSKNLTNQILSFFAALIFSSFLHADEFDDLVDELSNYNPKQADFISQRQRDIYSKYPRALAELVDEERHMHELRQAHENYLDFTIKTKYDSFAYGEPIILSLSLSNRGAKPINVAMLDDIDFYSDRCLRVEIFDDTGNLVISSIDFPFDEVSRSYNGRRYPVDAKFYPGTTIETNIIAPSIRFSVPNDPGNTTSVRKTSLSPGRYSVLVILELLIYLGIESNLLDIRVDEPIQENTQDFKHLSAMMNDKLLDSDVKEIRKFINSNPTSRLTPHLAIALMQSEYRPIVLTALDDTEMFLRIETLLQDATLAIRGKQPLVDNILTEIGINLIEIGYIEEAKLVLDHAVMAEGECSDEAQNLLNLLLDNQ